MAARAPILAVEDLSVAIGRRDLGPATILDGVSLHIDHGEVVGLVGESGCGKSTMVRAILGILPHAVRVERGRIVFDGQDLLKLDEAALTRTVRARRIGFIPQDPALAFNPYFTIGEQLLEIWRWHAPGGGRTSRAKGRDRLIGLLRRVQVPDAEAALDRYPHQFSGGQRQRLLIAGALLCEPEFIVADEPTTALDVTTQQQIIALLSELVRDLDLSVLFVTHDFGVVSQICSRVVVMYAGQIAESGPKPDVLRAPRHPYTQALIACHPDRLTRLSGIPGTVPSVGAMPSGCRFHPRCGRMVGACASRLPRLDTRSHGRQINCIHFDAPELAGPAA